MSVLDHVRAKFKTPMPGTSISSKSPSAGFAAPIHRRIESSGTASAGSAGSRCKYSESAPAEILPPLTPAQESARRDVLAMLDDNPAIERAMTNRFEDGVLIVTLAVRDIGTCELAIPAERFEAKKLANFAALMDCLDPSNCGTIKRRST